MRPAPRLYITESLGADPVALSTEHSRYLAQVLRLKEGDHVRLFNASDGEWVYRLTAAGKRGGAAEPITRRRAPEPPFTAPILFFAPVKRSPTELLVQKATELGVAALQPVITARTNRDNLRLDRLESIAIEAAEQSERLSLPSIYPPKALNEILVQNPPRFVFCDEAGDQPGEPWGGEEGRAPVAARTFDEVNDRPQAILIGPEGGFTEEERATLRAHAAAVPVSLGPRILRAETAAIVALTLWQASFGDMTSISS